MVAESQRDRLRILGIVGFALFCALFARLWYLQVVETEEYQLAAEVQNTRRIAVEAPRGRIIDAKGRVVVDNRTAILVTGDPVRLGEDDGPDVLYRLAKELTSRGMPTKLADLSDRLTDPQYSPVEPRPLVTDISPELEIYLLERDGEYPGITVTREAVRVYPYGELASHILGYVGRINEAEFAEQMDGVDPASVAKPYEANDHIGKTGVERSYEAQLRGTPGVQTIEVDARGDRISTLSYTPPVPGSDIQLTIDLEVQALTEAALVRGLQEARARPPQGDNPLPHIAPAGAAVVQDPRTGAIVAMASYPTYQPDEFVGGISTRRYQELLSGSGADPFTNRAIGGLYPPGSTFKLVSAYAGLRHGLITPNEWYADPGFYIAQGCDGPACRFQNAGAFGLGSVNLQKSLTLSSDVYYYRIGDRFWVEEGVERTGLQDIAEEFGLGRTTGIPLPFESGGHMPTAERRLERHEANPEAFPNAEWYSGDNIITAIGQGDVLLTPLQLAQVYSSFANGGVVFQPQIVSRVIATGGDPADPTTVEEVVQPEVTGRLPFEGDWWGQMHAGFVGVTQSGTARKAFDGWNHSGWPVAGKTGTAEVVGEAETAVFAAYAPANDPQYTVAVIMEESGFGGTAAAPVTRWILEPLSGSIPMPSILDQYFTPYEDDLELPPVGEACTPDTADPALPSTTTTTSPLNPFAPGNECVIAPDPLTAEELAAIQAAEEAAEAIANGQVPPELVATTTVPAATSQQFDPSGQPIGGSTTVPVDPTGGSP